MSNSEYILLINGKVLVDDQLASVDLLLYKGQIAAIASHGNLSHDQRRVVDVTGLTIIPGFIDIHTHGAAGVDINHLTREDLDNLGSFYATCGTTAFLPTVLTDTSDQIAQCCRIISEAMKDQQEQLTGATILGIHLEGPYLCPEYRGSMPLDLLRNPSWEELDQWQAAAGGAIRLITLSPEIEGAADLIQKAVSTGIEVSLGHSGASYDRAMSCIQAGARSATHTFNAMRLLHQHEPAVLGAVLESDIFCEMICDGRHLHPGIVRLLLKTKGIDRVIGVTDSIMATGLGDGQFKLGVNDIIVVNGDARLADGSSRAGSTLTMIEALRNALLFSGKSLGQISRLFSANPARLLNIDDHKGKIAAGYDGDLVIMDDNLTIRQTWVKGRCHFNHM